MSKFQEPPGLNRPRPTPSRLALVNESSILVLPIHSVVGSLCFWESFFLLSIWLRIYFLFSLLVFKGIYHCWKYCLFFPGDSSKWRLQPGREKTSALRATFEPYRWQHGISCTRCSRRSCEEVTQMAVGQSQWDPILGQVHHLFRADFSGDWDVHWWYDLDFDPWPNHATKVTKSQDHSYGWAKSISRHERKPWLKP